MPTEKLFPIWRPTQTTIDKSEMADFLAFVNSKTNKNFCTYWHLYDWSVKDYPLFWELAAEFLKIKWQAKPTETFLPPSEGKLLGGTWFPGGKLNFAQNLLPIPDNRIILTSYEEGVDKPYRYSTTELRQQVFRAAKSLKKLGVRKGDRVCGVLKNTGEAVIAMLATSCIGAVWSSCSPDFGVSGIVDRFQQIEPVVMFFSADYHYGGKFFDCLSHLPKCVKALKTLEKVIVIPTKGNKHSKNYSWQQFLDDGGSGDFEEGLFCQTDFNDPLYIMFSSGTTGAPKCIVHSVGGTLLQHKKELSLHCNMTEDSSLFFYTTCGWMMWNWMISAMSIGARVVLYDGSPAYPETDKIWKIASSEKLTVLGTSPAYLSTCIKKSLNISENDLKSLELILSTGSPLLPQHYQWIYNQVPSKVQLASISGGTDIISCFMLGNPLLPVYEGEIQAPGLGMAIASWNENAEPIIGEKGELVCTKPFPSMPIRFWNDPNNSTYHQSYFRFFEDKEVWRHGDYIEMTENRGVKIYGRSDSTLNPGGVRIGTAEIYRQVESLEWITDSVAISRQLGTQSEIYLFLRLPDNLSLDGDLCAQLKQHLRSHLTPRHVPHRIFQVKEIPYTKSGKKVELAISRIFAGEAVNNLSALTNPHSLEEYRRIAKSA